MIIVSNSSPLIAYSRIGKLNLLKDLFGTIIIPMEVFDELTTREYEFNHNWIEIRSISNISLKKSLELRLDCGESAAITLASELKADLLLMDERPGRHIAEYMEIDVTGTVGLLVKLAQSGKVNIKEELDNLIINDFWLSKKLYNWALDTGDTIKK